MAKKEEIENAYFNWMYKIVSDKASYRKLLSVLHSREFYFILPMDENRAADGVFLRKRFAWESEFDENEVLLALDGPCSVLEMMVALAIRIEEENMGIACDWFWLMIRNMGLENMTDSRFDKQKVEISVSNMLDRTYRRDGKGGLFCVKNRSEDMREVEIWYQMQWYLCEISNFS